MASAARWPQGSQTAFMRVGSSNTVVPREPGRNCMAFYDLNESHIVSLSSYFISGRGHGPTQIQGGELCSPQGDMSVKQLGPL